MMIGQTHGLPDFFAQKIPPPKNGGGKNYLSLDADYSFSELSRPLELIILIKNSGKDWP